MLTVGNVRQVTEYDEAGYDMTYDAVPVEAIEALPALDVAPVVQDDGYDWIDHDYTHDDGFCDEVEPKDGEADE